MRIKMKEMEKYYVYLHINKINNKVYVGITKRKYLCQRWRNGKGYRHCILFDRAIKKYGWNNFNHIKLFSSLSKDTAMQLERLLIKRYKRQDRSYNIGEGGEGTNSFSSETILKLKSYKGEKASQFGRKRLLEEKIKIGISTKKVWDSYSEKERKYRLRGLKPLKKGKESLFYGTHLSKERRDFLAEVNSKKVNCYDIHGNYICTYNSTQEAGRILNINNSHISCCALGKRKLTQGFQWKYYEGNINNIAPIYNKYIVLLDKDYNEIKRFVTIKDAANYVGKSYSCIKKILDNKTINPYSGLIFQYKEVNYE